MPSSARNKPVMVQIISDRDSVLHGAKIRLDELTSGYEGQIEVEYHGPRVLFYAPGIELEGFIVSALIQLPVSAIGWTAQWLYMKSILEPLWGIRHESESEEVSLDENQQIAYELARGFVDILGGEEIEVSEITGEVAPGRIKVTVKARER